MKPIGESAGGATLALADVGGKRIAFVADEDAAAILTYDVDARRQIAETPLGGKPSQVYVERDGRILATVRDRSVILALRVQRADAALATMCEKGTPAEPVALATTPDEKAILVSTGWAQKLAAFDGASLAPRFEVKLPREPRGVVVSDDGKKAFVSHAVGSVMSTVELEGDHHTTTIALRGEKTRGIRRHLRKMDAMEGATAFPSGAFDREHDGRQSCQGFTLAKSAAVPNRIFAPLVMVDPGDIDQRPSGYGDAASVPEIPAVAVIDEAEGAPMTTSIAVERAPMRIGPSEGECLLPRASAIDPTTKSVLVACFGIDAVVAYDALSATPSSAVRRSWNVGAGPTGIAIDPAKREAVVFSQFDRTISVIALGNDELVDDKSAPPKIERTELARRADAPPASLVIGRMLFHASGDERISSDGRACASCHPDGRDDAITWATPSGPRRSIMLAGRLPSSAPYSWDGNAPSVQSHLGATFTRLKGRGLRSFELDALVGYVSSLPAPPSRVVATADRAKVDRGREIFASTEAGCAGCHSGSGFTDGETHDVGSKHSADANPEFNTPSLHFVGGTGPWFHDGRYASLGDLLRQSDGKMGHTKQLSPTDLGALQTYLEAL